MDENLMKIGAIALCLIICVPIGLGYAMSFEDVEQDVVNSGRGTSITDTLLNDNYGTVENYNNPINNQYVYFSRDEIQTPNYNVVGTNPTPYPEMSDFEDLDIVPSTIPYNIFIDSSRSVDSSLLTLTLSVIDSELSSQGGKVIQIYSSNFRTENLSWIYINNFPESIEFRLIVFDNPVLKSEDPSIARENMRVSDWGTYSTFFKNNWSFLNYATVDNDNKPYFFNPFTNEWVRRPNDTISNSMSSLNDKYYLGGGNSAPYFTIQLKDKTLDSDTIRNILRDAYPTQRIQKYSSITTFTPNTTYKIPNTMLTNLQSKIDSNYLPVKYSFGLNLTLNQNGNILSTDESGKLIEITPTQLMVYSPFESNVVGESSKPNGLYADYVYGWTMPTDRGFFLHNLQNNKQYTIFASMDTNPANAISSTHGTYIGGAFDFLPIYQQNKNYGNPLVDSEWKERMYIGWKKNIDTGWVDRYIEIWEEHWDSEQNRVVADNKIWEKHISDLGDYTNVRVTIDCNHWRVEFFNTFAQIGATNSVQTFYIPKQTPLDFITHVEIRQDTSFPKTTFRVDSTQIVSGKLPVSRNVVYDHVEKFGDTSYMVKIHSVAVYGDSITFGGQTFTIIDGINIEVNGIKQRIRDINFMSYKPPSTTENPNPKYTNSINGEFVSESDTQSTLGLDGIWIVTAYDYSLSTSKEKTKQFVAGGFGLDKSSFSLMAMVVAVAVFIGLGFWGIRSGAKIGILFLICGGAILFFTMFI